MRNISIQKQRAFTLVELIVVITILSILWTIAFLSFQWYSRDARDSKRTSDIWNIKTTLELFNINAWKFPSPDSPSTISYSWDTVWYQWTLWDGVTTNLKWLDKKPLDPLTQAEYIYSTTQSYKEYQVLALYEWNVAYNQVPSPIRRGLGWGLIPTANAATTSLTPKVVWNYNELFVQTNNYIVPTPSIITSEPWSIVLDWTKIKSQVITNWTNIPQNSLTKTSTGQLNMNLSVYTWSIKSTSPVLKILKVVEQIQNTYSWTSLIKKSNIAYVLNQTTNEQLLELANNTILKWLKPVSTKIDWRDLDPNCDIADITIYSWATLIQTWAWCNSTLWTWIEYDVDQSCYDYQWLLTTGCNRPSNEKEYIYNSTYGINNIWWKLYIWANSPSACTIWYHVPSDEDWYNLEVALWSTDVSNNWLYSWIQTWWLSAWLWWAGHTTKTSSNNIVQALKIPLSGYRLIDGVTFYARGYHIRLWSSLTSPYFSTKAYGRRMVYYDSTVIRQAWDKAYGASVRCLKN